MLRLDLMERFEKRRAELSVSGPIKPVPLKFGLPLLEAAALENDPDLRDMLATLLAVATDPSSDVVPRRAMVSIISEMDPLDAKVLLAAFNSPPANSKLYPVRTVFTAGLPEAFIVPVAGDYSGIIKEPPAAVKVALWNLVKLGCIAPAGVWDGAVTIGLVTVTDLGIAFIEASTLPEQRIYRPSPPDAVA